LNLSLNHMASERGLVGLGALRSLRWVDLRGNVFNAALNTQVHARVPPLAAAFPVLYRFVALAAGVSLVVANPSASAHGGAAASESAHILSPATAKPPAATAAAQHRRTPSAAAGAGHVPGPAATPAAAAVAAAATATAAPVGRVNPRWEVPAESTVAAVTAETGAAAVTTAVTMVAVVRERGRGPVADAEAELRYLLAAGSVDIAPLLQGSAYAHALPPPNTPGAYGYETGAAGPHTTQQLRAAMRPRAASSLRAVREHAAAAGARGAKPLTSAGSAALAFTAGAGRPAERARKAVAAREGSVRSRYPRGALGLYARVDDAVAELEAATRLGPPPGAAHGAYVGGHAVTAVVSPRRAPELEPGVRAAALGLQGSVQTTHDVDPHETGVFVSRQMTRAAERREKEKRAHDVELLLRTVNSALADSLWTPSGPKH
jgi:hypothetical protein